MVIRIKQSDSKERVEMVLKNLSAQRAAERKKKFKNYFGTIKLDEDPVVLQRRWRDEW